MSAVDLLAIFAELAGAIAGSPESDSAALVDDVLGDRQLTRKELLALSACCWAAVRTLDGPGVVALGFVGAELQARANPAPVGIGESGNAGDFSMTVSDVRWPANPPENLGLHRPTFMAFDVEITNTVREPRPLNLLWLQVEDTSGKRLSWRAVDRPPSLPLVVRDRVLRGGAVVPDRDPLAPGETRAGTVYVELPATGSGAVLVFGPPDDPQTIVPLVGSDPGSEDHRPES